MLRSVVAQLRADLSRPAEVTPVTRPVTDRPLQESASGGAEPRTWTSERVHFAFNQLQHEFHDHLVRFDELRARAALDRINALLAAHPAQIDAEQVARCERVLAHLADRRVSLEAHVDKLEQRAVDAARRGDHEAAARALRRLSTVHALRPVVLPDDRFRAVRDAMIAASQDREHQRAARALIDRERAVAAEIRTLANVIHRFHVVVRTTPHDAPEYRDAERRYHEAVAQVRSHDRDWFAALILELVDLLEEGHLPPHKGQHQVDRFLDSVRAALHNLRAEIQKIETESRHPAPPPARPGTRHD
ncbi:MAG: hypothetical protein FLDDKLPJ_00870 [Phycisphaerae bacterium]|nr:hypothetical protein [Phycisphaerae bacterium]